LAHRADAGTLGVEAGNIGFHCDFRAVTGFPGHGDDLHRPVGDLGNFQRKQLAHQVGVGARQRDQLLADTAGDADHVAAQPVAVLVHLAGDLLGGRDHALGALRLAAQPHHDQAAGVGTAVTLNHSGDDLALPGGELAVIALVLGVAQPLQDHLARGGGRDPAETLGGVVPFADDVAVVIGFAGDHPYRTGLAVDVDTRVGLVPFGVPVGGQQRG